MKKLIMWAIVDREIGEIEQADYFMDSGCGCDCGGETRALAIYKTKKEAEMELLGRESFKIIKITYELPIKKK